MKRRSKILLTGGVVAAVLAAVALFASRDANADDAGAAAAVTVARGDVVARALAVGTIEPEVEVGVKSKVSGVVRQLFAEPGTFVRAGQPLLEIRPDPTPVELVEARRQVELRGIEFESVQREAERQRALQERGLISAQERESADRRLAEAALQQRMAREKLQLLEQGSIRGAGGVESVVRAPIDGFLLEKNIEVGDPVVPLSSYQEGTVLMTMANMERLLFRGTVDEIDVGRLSEGMPVEIKIGALPDVKLTGRVHRISLKAQKQESATTFPVEIALDAAEGVTLRAGLSANADVIIQKREGVLVIPERVVTFEDGGAWVQVARADGTSEKRVIRTGLSDAIQVEVLEGLKEGERVLEKAEKSVQ